MITALIIGAVSIVAEFTVNLVFNYIPSFPIVSDLAILATVSQLISFLILPVALFIIVYFVAAGANTDLTKTFLPMIGSLFVGAILGYSFAYAGMILLVTGQPFVSLIDYTAVGISAISLSIEEAFVGFSAITLQYLLSGKLTNAAQGSPEL